MANSKKCLVLTDKDNVAVALDFVQQGELLVYEVPNLGITQITALEEIPPYHKVAIKPIQKNGQIYKYGQVIGQAIVDITPGQHIHTHNIVSLREAVNQTGGDNT